MASIAPVTPASAADLWADTAATPYARSALAEPVDKPARYREVTLDIGQLTARRAMARSHATSSIELPLPEGGTSRFELTDAGTLPPGLAARFPGLTSLTGRDAAGRLARVDMTADSLHASITDASGDWQVRPSREKANTTKNASARGASRPHIVFRKQDAPVPAHYEKALRSTRNHVQQAMTPSSFATATRRGGSSIQRTFRLAMSATSSYVESMGGTTEDGLAGIMRTVNRLNGIFENDLGVHLVLAEDNDRLVYADPATDPFADIDPDAADEIAARNGQVAVEQLGEEGFDVGHVLTGKGAGGVAGLGNTCLAWSDDAEETFLAKGIGMTGSDRPFGDAFHVDFVAHELGHQFGASHTFNGCGRTHDGDGAFEPGSGSTIMGYAGICDDHDLQKHSDSYFHSKSIEHVQSWLAGAGGACAEARLNTSPGPVVDRPGNRSATFIPARTPFRLKASTSFVDPLATLSYTFEQVDAGPSQPEGSPLADTGKGPIFRSRAPSPSPEQTFPAMSVLLGDEAADLGDTLPTVSRNLHFRLTVRDGLDHRSHTAGTDYSVSVVDTGAAFEVLAPAASTAFRRGKARTIRWNVAGTTEAPISCSSVQIDLSLDGGRTFLDTPLLPYAPNTGRASITVPTTVAASRQAKLRLTCTRGGFFALSPGNYQLR